MMLKMIQEKLVTHQWCDDDGDGNCGGDDDGGDDDGDCGDDADDDEGDEENVW